MTETKNPKPIIMIDDDEMARYLFKAIIQRSDPALPIMVFPTAFEVVDLLAQNSIQPALIVLDINMPVMNGWEFLEALEKLSYTVPVYMLSSSDDAADLNRAKKFENVKDYFVKPLTIENLNTILTRHFPR
jgi:CheY-like chemotaxis protein